MSSSPGEQCARFLASAAAYCDMKAMAISWRFSSWNLLARLEDARMVVAEGQRAEAAEEVEDLAAVLVDVVHALGALDLHLVEAEQLHEVELAGIDVSLNRSAIVVDVERLGVLDGQQRRLGRAGRASAGADMAGRRRHRDGLTSSVISSYSAGTLRGGRRGWPSFLARYSL